jgi:hypothetical protein
MDGQSSSAGWNNTANITAPDFVNADCQTNGADL